MCRQGDLLASLELCTVAKKVFQVNAEYREPGWSETQMATTCLNMVSIHMAAETQNLPDALTQLREAREICMRSTTGLEGVISSTIEEVYSCIDEIIASHPDWCQTCGREDAPFLCLCESAAYCGEYCQRQHWREHRKECVAPTYVEYLAAREEERYQHFKGPILSYLSSNF
jgi:hypothetical protein